MAYNRYQYETSPRKLKPEYEEIEGVKIPKIRVHPFEASAAEKIILALSLR